MELENYIKVLKERVVKLAFTPKKTEQQKQELGMLMQILDSHEMHTSDEV